MITREQIPQVVGHPVHDAEGKKVGDAKHMYLDDKSGNPEWVTVKTGFFGSNETFVPTRSARLVQDHLEVPYPKEKIQGAPNVDVDSGGHLSVDEEQHLYRYYGIERADKAAAPDRTAETAGAAGAAGAAAGAGTAAATTSSGGMGTDTGRASGGPAMDKSATGADTGTAAGYAAGRGGSAERMGAGGMEAETEAEALTRSEEEMHVTVERRASGKARLHKYVEVEEVEQTVPLRHEEVQLEREPLSAADREAMRSGAQISEAERFVTLHEESPVVETEVVAKERVRMRVEEHVEQKKVQGRVRKERIEADMDEPTDALPGDDPTRGSRPER